MGRLSTFSIAARDPGTGMLGVAVSSKAFSAGSLCPFVTAGVGAVATQAWVNPYLGPAILSLLSSGLGAQEALARALADDPQPELRQLNVVDALGRSATYTGSRTDPWCGGRRGTDYAVAGNILVSEATIDAMETAFLTVRGRDLADRLISVLEAGQEAGGDARGRQSAAVIVANRTQLPYLDLRVDDHPDPVAELRRLYRVAAEDGGGAFLRFQLKISSVVGSYGGPEGA
ncbi:MAG TPA: DUF1028 domain-containing protein [Thermoleophilia bacterium]|nr:DUF1028 domain-containing protein [Thermoleophilia bacterium]